MLTLITRQIWSALEERNFFRAANMYVTSKFIFDSIQNERDSANRKLSKSFPILFRQWDSIHPFKDNIVRTAREFLTSSQPEDASIEAVAAVMVVEQLTNVAALRWYLDVKSAAVAGAFTAAPSTGAGTAVDPTQRICTVVGSITQALRHVNALFGNGGDADTTEDAGPEVGSGLGKVSRFLSRAVSPDRPEAAGGLFLSQALPATVRNFRPPLARGALEKLPVETLQEACAKWFQELSSVVLALPYATCELGSDAPLVRLWRKASGGPSVKSTPSVQWSACATLRGPCCGMSTLFERLASSQLLQMTLDRGAGYAAGFWAEKLSCGRRSFNSL